MPKMRLALSSSLTVPMGRLIIDTTLVMEHLEFIPEGIHYLILGHPFNRGDVVSIRILE
jgi:hypothetical protein